MPEQSPAAPPVLGRKGQRLLPISALVLTRNEEVNLLHTLENVCSFVNDVVVLDSYSTDRTREVAGRFPCRILQHEFLNFAEQRNWALRNIPWRHEWLLTVDADETFPEPLVEEIGSILNSTEIPSWV